MTQVLRIAPALRALTLFAKAQAIALGDAVIINSTLVPALRGGDGTTLEEALAGVQSEIKRLADAKEAGEQIDDAELDGLKDKETQLKELGGTPAGGGFSDIPTKRADETDDQFLRRFHQETIERREVADLVSKTVGQQLSAQRQKEERMKTYAEEAIQGLFGGASNLNDAVAGIMKSTRSASRFAGEGATTDFVKELGGREDGDAGRFSTQDGKSALSAGDDREIAYLQKRAMPVEKGGDGVGLGQFITLLYGSKYGMLTDGERRYFDGLRRKALAEGTQTAGGVLVPREWMQDLLGLLRAQAVVRRANPRIQRFNKEMFQTSVSSGATAFYTQENAQIPVSEETFAEAPLLTPKNLTALVPASNYLLNDADEAENFVRADLAEIMSLREDLAFLRGTGTLGEPRGFRNIAGLTLDPINPTGAGVQLTIAQLRRIRAIFRSLNAGAVRPTWFFNPEFLTYLETMEEMSGGSPTGRTLLDAELITYDDDTMTAGRFDGIRFFSTTQLPNGTTGGNPTTELYLVNMAEAIVGENQELEIDLSTEASYWDGAAWVSAFQNNQTVFRAVMRHDIAHRRPNQIIVQTGARTT